MSTRSWWWLRGGAGDAQRTRAQSEGSRRGSAVDGRRAAMAESASARVRVPLARLGGAFGMAEPRGGAGCPPGGRWRWWVPTCPRDPRALPTPVRFLPRGAGAPAPRTFAGNLLGGLFPVRGLVTVPTRFLRGAKESPFPGWRGGAGWKLWVRTAAGERAGRSGDPGGAGLVRDRLVLGHCVSLVPSATLSRYRLLSRGRSRRWKSGWASPLRGQVLSPRVVAGFGLRSGPVSCNPRRTQSSGWGKPWAWRQETGFQP